MLRTPQRDKKKLKLLPDNKGIAEGSREFVNFA
jgi:hypothetical protein